MVECAFCGFRLSVAFRYACIRVGDEADGGSRRAPPGWTVLISLLGAVLYLRSEGDYACATGEVAWLSLVTALAKRGSFLTASFASDLLPCSAFVHETSLGMREG